MKIVGVVARAPHPPRSGYQLRAWELLRRLARGHEVRLACTDAPESAGKWTEEFETVRFVPRRTAGVASGLRSLVSRVPHHAFLHASPDLARALEELSSDADVVVSHYLYFARALPVRPGLALVLDQHNVDSQSWQSLVPVGPRWARPWAARQARLVRGDEIRFLPSFDTVLSVSEPDAALTRALLAEAGATGTRVAVAPNGADVDGIHPAESTPPAPPTVVFTGTDARRNVDGISWFLERCWPLVREAVPDARLLVVGRVRRESLPRRVRGAPGLELTGPVPSVEPHLQAAHVAIVPVRRGGGTKLKVFEAMAAGLPVVASEESARGIDARSEREWVVADGEASYAAAVIRLLREPESARDLGLAARRWVERGHSWDVVAGLVERELAAAVERRRQRPGGSKPPRSGASGDPRPRPSAGAIGGSGRESARKP